MSGGVEVDLCIGNHLGIQNSRLVAAYCQLDRRVGEAQRLKTSHVGAFREVCRLVKQWAKSAELVGAILR